MSDANTLIFGRLVLDFELDLGMRYRFEFLIAVLAILILGLLISSVMLEETRSDYGGVVNRLNAQRGMLTRDGQERMQHRLRESTIMSGEDREVFLQNLDHFRMLFNNVSLELGEESLGDLFRESILSVRVSFSYFEDVVLLLDQISLAPGIMDTEECNIDFNYSVTFSGRIPNHRMVCHFRWRIYNFEQISHS